MPAKLRLVRPASDRVWVTVGGRKTNGAMGRVREHLDPNLVKRLTQATKKNRKDVRDALMIYKIELHGYCANELVELKRSAINLERHIYASHDQRAASIQHMPWIAMRRVPWVSCSKMPLRAPFVFISERKAPIRGPGLKASLGVLA
jgi:hypothetical protein